MGMGRLSKQRFGGWRIKNRTASLAKQQGAVGCTADKGMTGVPKGGRKRLNELVCLRLRDPVCVVCRDTARLQRNEIAAKCSERSIKFCAKCKCFECSAAALTGVLWGTQKGQEGGQTAGGTALWNQAGLPKLCFGRKRGKTRGFCIVQRRAKLGKRQVCCAICNHNDVFHREGSSVLENLGYLIVL